jgi:hypothetical protein
MSNDTCGVCDGSGTTYLHSVWGDPCPECGWWLVGLVAVAVLLLSFT